MDEKSVVATVRAITIDERDGYCTRAFEENDFLAFRRRLFPFRRLMSLFFYATISLKNLR